MKKLLVLAIAALMVMTLTYAPRVGAVTLSDISGHPFEKEITKLVEAGVVSGFPDGTFKPDQEVTRAQFAKLVAVAFGLNTTGFTTSTFNDVPADHWALGYIEAVAAKGWVKGFPDGGFHPEENITREQMATLMIRVLGREEDAKKYQEAFVQANDCAAVSDWAWGAVTIAYHSDVQILTYHPGRTIEPQKAATRAETAYAVYHAMKPPTQGGQVVIGMAQEPAKMYPYHNNMAAKSMILNCVLDGWIGVAPEGTGTEQKGIYYPIFAQEVPSLENGLVKLNEDGTMEITWHLRKTPVYWSDGVQVTLDDAIFGHEVLVNEAIPADSRDPEDAVVSIEKLDDYTLKVVYSSEKSAAVYGPAFSLAKHKYGDLVATNPEGFFRSDVNTYPLGHGAYKIDSWTVGSSMTLSARDDYHFGKPNIKKLVWLFIPDASTIYARIASGDLDLTIPGIGVTTATAIDNLNAIPGVVYEIHPSTYTEHIEFNLWNYDGVKHPIFNPPDDPESGRLVRLAIANALNREEASTVLYKGYEPPAFSMCPPAVAIVFVTAEEIGLDLVPTYNPEKAKQLLDQAGWKDTDGDGIRDKAGKKFEVQLSTTNRTDRQQMATIWQKNLADVGIKVNLDFKPGGVFFSDNWAGYKRGYPDMVEFAWGSTDPRYPVTDVFRGDRIAWPENPQGQNYCGYSNPEYDKWAQIIQDTFDIAKAKEANLMAQRILLQDMPVVPLLFYADAALYKARLQGIDDPNWSSITWNVAYWYWE
ncbi:MAG: ABC transporter substrate-binding protein [Coprothermobacterota bacterium]|nr:ABC transporter substrate-binding protein [Coprothermobacterota bacterium]